MLNLEVVTTYKQSTHKQLTPTCDNSFIIWYNNIYPYIKMFIHTKEVVMYYLYLIQIYKKNLMFNYNREVFHNASFRESPQLISRRLFRPLSKSIQSFHSWRAKQYERYTTDCQNIKMHINRIYHSSQH